MNSVAIPVDLRNPGQVFACLGIAETVQTSLDHLVESAFRCEPKQTRGVFEISSPQSGNAIREVVDFLRKAKVFALIPAGSHLSTETWSIDAMQCREETFPTPIPPKPASLPVQLAAGATAIMLSSWADGAACGLDNVKFWAGAGGYPGAGLARDIVQLVHDLSDDAVDAVATDPLNWSAPMTSSFRFDWRRDYVPIDVGFSPNNHSDVTMVGYPLTELLAAIGLQYARPVRIQKLRYRYGIWSEMLPNVLARPVLGTVQVGSRMRTFEMMLDWPGKAGQARCIIDAREEM